MFYERGLVFKGRSKKNQVKGTDFSKDREGQPTASPTCRIALRWSPGWRKGAGVYKHLKRDILA